MFQSLDDDSVQSRDVLSVLLRTVRLRGEEVVCCALASPFAISFDHPGGTIHIVSLTGAMDPVVGDAMTTIHANPAHRWTIAGLARRSHLSRSAFADRFTRRVGEPPATYMAQLRLSRAPAFSSRLVSR
jgi:transcriptional regulator GlxA family with amidase domain